MGILPNSDSLLRLATAVLQVQHDEWQDGKGHFSQASLALLSGDSQKLLTNPLRLVRGSMNGERPSPTFPTGHQLEVHGAPVTRSFGFCR